MTALRVNASVDQAQAAAERWAQLDGVLATSRAARQAAIAATNAAADAIDRPLIDVMDALRVDLDGWYRRNAGKLTGGKRKSAELGGCMLALKSSRAALDIAGDEKGLAATLAGKTWGKDLVRTAPALDKPAILKALADRLLGRRLMTLGFTRRDPVDRFHLDRVDQAGVADAA